jgi:hypothetical protein
VVQVLLAIISTVAGVIGALSAAVGVVQQRRQTPPQTLVIIVTNNEAPAVTALPPLTCGDHHR